MCDKTAMRLSQRGCARQDGDSRDNGDAHDKTAMPGRLPAPEHRLTTETGYFFWIGAVLPLSTNFMNGVRIGVPQPDRKSVV